MNKIISNTLQTFTVYHTLETGSSVDTNTIIKNNIIKISNGFKSTQQWKLCDFLIMVSTLNHTTDCISFQYLFRVWIRS